MPVPVIMPIAAQPDFTTAHAIAGKDASGNLVPIAVRSDGNLATGDPGSSVAITPSDSTDLTATVLHGIEVFVPLGATATIAFKLKNDSTANSAILAANQYLPGNFARVMATGTTLNGATIIGYGD